jgi:hypothetical protein
MAASSAAGKCAEWKEAVLEVEEVVEVVDGRRGRELVAVVVVVGAEEWAKAGGPEEGGLTRSGRVLGPEDLKDIVCVWCASSAVVKVAVLLEEEKGCLSMMRKQLWRISLVCPASKGRSPPKKFREVLLLSCNATTLLQSLDHIDPHR